MCVASVVIGLSKTQLVLVVISIGCYLLIDTLGVWIGLLGAALNIYVVLSAFKSNG